MSIEFSPAFAGTGRRPVRQTVSHGPAARATPRRLSPRRRKRPISPRRLAANRANARKSTGPRSAAGKRRVSRNALKHGLCARYGARLPTECDATFGIFLNEIREDLRPTTTMQRALFPQIANLLWRLERLPQAQADIFEQELKKTSRHRGRGKQLTPAQVLAERFSADKDNGFVLLDRYERSMRNALLRLLKEFDRLGKRQLPEDPDERVPREGSGPAWTAAQQKRQEETFARRKEQIEQHVPPRDEYEASVDLTLWRCAQARRLAEQERLRAAQQTAQQAAERTAEQTQSNPTETPDGDAQGGKWRDLSEAPPTEQSHRDPASRPEM